MLPYYVQSTPWIGLFSKGQIWDDLEAVLRIRIRDLFDPGSGMEKFGYGINIPDPQHCLEGSIYIRNKAFEIQIIARSILKQKKER